MLKCDFNKVAKQSFKSKTLITNHNNGIYLLNAFVDNYESLNTGLVFRFQHFESF